MAIEYITTRELKNKNGQIAGKIRVLKLKENTKATIDFTCPNCRVSDRRESEFKLPFLMECSKCGHPIKLIQLKKEMKKEKKKEKI